MASEGCDQQGDGPKVVIQIPCYNEVGTLAQTIADLPRQLEGVGRVELMVIDDGSTDGTAELAARLGVHHVIRHPHNRGLAAAYLSGLDAALRAGADVIVNTDADNQYHGQDVAVIAAPVVAGSADIVIGARPISEIKTFSATKRLLQRVGSRTVRLTSGTRVEDATSGFRAVNREAALRLQVFGRYTYTLETIIQAGVEGLRVASVPIRVNPPTRTSRLVSSSFNYVARSVSTILRSYARYRPFRFFAGIGLVPFALSAVLFARWITLHYIVQSSASRVPSLIVAGVSLLLAVQLWALGVLADLIAANRRVLSELRLSARRAELLRVDSRGAPADDG